MIDQFHGSRARNGQWAGITVGEQRYRYDTSFAFEPRLNVFEESATDTFFQSRCLEYFLRKAKDILPSDTDQRNPRGFWFYFNRSNLAVASAFSANVGILHNFSSSPDTRVFCTAEWKNPKASAKDTTLYYTCDLTIETCPINGSAYL
jgi:hypothetical protein